jgi:excisionase family DNA binding protein
MTVDPSDREDSFLTVSEVAETLKLNQQTVRNWIEQGSLPAVRVGRRVRIKRSDFERVVAEGYSAGSRTAARDTGPSAADFWGGEPIGVPEMDIGASDVPDRDRLEADQAQPHPRR